MKPGILIKPATISELNSILAIDRDEFSECHLSKYTIRMFYDLFPDLILVAKSNINKEVMAFSVGAITTSSAWILALAVKEGYQNLGIGKMLLASNLDMFCNSGAKEACLTVSPSNQKAIAIYEKMGFREIEQDECYFGENEARILMKRICQ